MSIAPVSLITPLFVCRTEQQQYLCYYFEYCCLNVDSSRGRIFTLDIGSSQLSTQAHLETYYKVSVTQQQAEQPRAAHGQPRSLSEPSNSRLVKP